ALKKFEDLAPRLRADRAAATLLAYAGTGRKDQTIGLLRKAYAEHSSLVTNLKVDPLYDQLREDPRFQDLLQRVGLAK
ncbi:MAG TPA: hypothetical protein VFE61_04820, partial [Candidatus Sulfotelmatobacter sp.]|nr:hypothetical protein [Candidatus Sulfotelmatobacter sp.]